MIHICFGLYDKTGRYSKFTGTAMCSLFENSYTPPHSITVHILHDNTLSQDNRDKFSYLAGSYHQLVKFYNVEELCADRIAEFWNKIPTISTFWATIGSFYRLLIHNVLSDDIDKCIYLDSDMLVNLDIRELWQIELENSPLAAVPEHLGSPFAFKGYSTSNYLLTANLVKYEDYFNAGLLLMDLNYLRSHDELITDGVKWYGEHLQCRAHDQDILNYLFTKNYLKLPVKFDRFVYDERRAGRTEIERAIYHYSHPNLTLDSNDVFNRFWLSYYMKTPFYDDKTLVLLYEGLKQRYYNLLRNLKSSMVSLSALMSGKTRAFFIPPSEVENMKQIFSIRNGEEIILAENDNSLQKLIKAMKRSQGKKIFLIIVPDFPFDVLTSKGFVVGKDFLNGVQFLMPVNNECLDSYSLVKDM